MEKKSPGKYVLVFEPKYAYCQYAVYFTPNNDVQITKIKRFTDLDYTNDKPVKKNLLGDIDRITSPCSDLKQFFDTYIDPRIFSYYGYNLHNMFIAYKNNGTIRTLDYSINNSKLNTKLNSVDGNKFTNKDEIIELIDFAVNTDQNNTFLDFVGERKNKYKTGLTYDTYSKLEELRRYKKVLEEQYDTGVLVPTCELNEMLIEKLSSYKEYRELFLLKQAYKENKKTEVVNKELPPQIPSLFLPDENLEYEQLNLFGEVVKPYQKTKKRK